MYALSRARFVLACEEFEARGLALSVSRTLLACAELVTLLANSDRVLFGPVSAERAHPVCSGVSGVSLWCVTGAGARPDVPARVVAVVILVAVAAGFRPRWLCVPHWYVAFSLSTAIVPSDGGDQVAQIIALLMIPLCLGDRRVWQWQPAGRDLAPSWRGASYAAHLVLRCQIAVIYLEAVVSKLAFPAWRQGTALPVIMNDPYSGLPLALRPAAARLLALHGAGAAATWGVLAAESFIALSMLFRARVRRWGLVCGICLHAGIIVGMGFAGFGLIMIALLLPAAVRDPGGPGPALPRGTVRTAGARVTGGAASGTAPSP